MTSPQEVKEKTKAFLSDRKNVNNVMDILSCCQSDKDEVILAAVRSLHKIFSLLLAQGDLQVHQPHTSEIPEDAGPEEQFRRWLLCQYAETHVRLRELVLHPSQHVQELALCTAMKLLESEGNFPVTRVATNKHTFPEQKFQDIFAVLLNEGHSMTELIGRFQEYLEYDDVRYNSLACCSALLNEKDMELSQSLAENLFAVLDNVTIPKTDEGEKYTKFLVKLPEDCSASAATKIQSPSEHKKLFTKVWTEFLRHKLSTSLYKRILVNLHEKVMPGMSNPLLLSDFLTASYSIGGSISLLALNGLFILVNYYNLEYPDFYKKLYGLLEPSVFHVKYRARFFFLTDLFLTSTHLPAYMVAAFIKRLARLALTAPPSGLEIIIPFIYNLLLRHPNCRVLVHKPGGPKDLVTDPYNAEEPDPEKSNALASSLWELKTLQHHYHHFLARKATQISRSQQSEEISLQELLEMKTSDIFHKELKNRIKEMPVTFSSSQGIFQTKDDQFSDLWSLE